MKDEWIRVNLAGERGARAIYAGQLWALRYKELLNQKSRNNLDDVCAQENLDMIEIIQKMDAQEAQHVEWFEALARSKQIRPSLLQPFWNVGGFALGALTAWMGKEAAMACTQAVETIIDQHYEDQIQGLKREEEKGNHDEILEILEKCQQDEQEHKETAKEYGAEKAHPMIFEGICALTSLAIWIAKKI